MNRMPSVMYGKDQIEYLHIIDGKILCGDDLIFKGESCKKCKHHAGIIGTEPGRYVICTRHIGLVLPPVVDLQEEYDPALKYVDGSDRDMFAYDQDELADMAQHLGAQVTVDVLDLPDPCNGVCCLECNYAGCVLARY